MEYKLAAAFSWTPVTTGSSVTGLATGTYFVRVKATASAFKSVEVPITISPFGASQEATPIANIDSANEKLTGLTANANYTVNGVAKTADAYGGIVIEESWFGTRVSIVKKGNGSTTTDSLPQSLAVPARSTNTSTVTVNLWTNDTTILASASSVTLSPYLSVVITGLNGAEYTNHQWSINGSDVAAPEGTATSFYFDSTRKGNGNYNIELQVQKNSIWYSITITITVTD
jgi:hypothetical protein